MTHRVVETDQEAAGPGGTPGGDEPPREPSDAEALQLHIESILASAPDAMCVIDEHGVVQAFSRAGEELFGYPAGDVIGRNVSMLMTEYDRTHHDAYMERYMRTGERRIIGIGRVVTARRKDGTRFPIDLKIGEARIGQHYLFTAFMRDLSEQQRAELRMREMQSELVHFSRLSAVGTMASAMAHELNQPLTAVSNYLEAARDMLEDPSPEVLALVQEALDEAAKQSVRAGQIVRKLRDYVARGDIDARPIQLEPIVRDAISLARIGSKADHVRIDERFDAAPGLIMADPIQVQQVLINLLKNAFEALADQQDARVTVALSEGPGQFVTFRVEDNGPGITPEFAEQLFRPFASSKSTGMGLGLSICQTIVEAHGGSIRIEPRAARGTTFLFTLPRPDSPSP